MDEFEIDRIADPSLDDPVLIEGLPGVGHVGKLAAEHLLEEFDAELVRRIHSEHFPPQVTVEDGRTRLAAAEVHAIEGTEHDCLVLTGDHQAGDGPGHYRLTTASRNWSRSAFSSATTSPPAASSASPGYCSGWASAAVSTPPA